jgi:hypothetical protein
MEGIFRVARGIEDDGNRLSSIDDEVDKVGNVKEQTVTDAEVYLTSKVPRPNIEKQAGIITNIAIPSQTSLKQKANLRELP